MLLYTTEPLELVLGTGETRSFSSKNVDGILLEGEDSVDGFKISRILSTNPKAYLNTAYAPGKTIK